MKPTRLLIGLVAAFALTLACGINIDTGDTQASPTKPPTEPLPSPSMPLAVCPTLALSSALTFRSLCLAGPSTPLAGA